MRYRGNAEHRQIYHSTARQKLRIGCPGTKGLTTTGAGATTTGEATVVTTGLKVVTGTAGLNVVTGTAGLNVVTGTGLNVVTPTAGLNVVTGTDGLNATVGRNVVTTGAEVIIGLCVTTAVEVPPQQLPTTGLKVVVTTGEATVVGNVLGK